MFTFPCHATMLEAFWHPLLATSCRRQAEINLHNDYEDGFTQGATRQLGMDQNLEHQPRRQLCLSLLLTFNEQDNFEQIFFLISIFICIFKKKIFVISFSIIYMVSILLFMIRTNIRPI